MNYYDAFNTFNHWASSFTWFNIGQILFDITISLIVVYLIEESKPLKVKKKGKKKS